jgi:hypothetical protein
MDKKNGYNLSRQWFDFTQETSEMVTPMHTALYFWIVDLNNRLQWKEVIGLPTDHTMNAIRIKSYKSYKKALDDLIRWGFLKLITRSRNQHTCNEVALVLKTKAETKAETKADASYINSINSTNLETPKLGADKILNLFLEVHGNYSIIDNKQREKELAAAQTLIEAFEKETPGLGEEVTIEHFRQFFGDCVEISDKWLRPQMCPSIIVTHFNRIKNTLANPSGGATAPGGNVNAQWDDQPPKAGTRPDLRNVDTTNRLNGDDNR